MISLCAREEAPPYLGYIRWLNASRQRSN